MGIIISIITAIAVLFSIGAYNKNKAPVASAQTLSINEDSRDNKITLKAYDRDKDKLTYKIIQKPKHGILKTNNTNMVTYTPTKDYFGKDSFTFRANDGEKNSNLARVRLNIKDMPEVINHKPIAFEQNLSILKNKPQNITLKATDEDNDTLTYMITSAPQHGSLSGTAPNIIYTPNTDYEGNDTISFKAYDGKVYSNESKVNLKVSTSAFSNVWAKFIPNARIKEMVIDKNSNNLYLIGTNNIFAKYNTNGEQIWTKPIDLRGIKVDTQGNIYGFMGSKFFKYNPNGDEIFAQDINKSITTIATDKNNNFYVIGDTNLSLDDNINAGKNDIFLIKYNSNGIKIWSKLIGKATNDRASSIAIDNDGNIYIGVHTATTPYISKYNNSGSHIWTKKIENTSRIHSSSFITRSINNIMIDDNNDVYINGIIDGVSPTLSTILIPIEVNNAYILKMDSNGQIEWFKEQEVGPLGTSISSIQHDSNGKIYFIGTTRNREWVDSHFTTKINYSYSFIKAISPEGNITFTKEIYSTNGTKRTGSNSLESLCIDSNDNIYLGGTTWRSTNVDRIPHEPINSNTIFLMKYR